MRLDELHSVLHPAAVRSLSGPIRLPPAGSHSLRLHRQSLPPHDARPAQERAMTDFPFMWPYSLFAPPKEINQSINPGWFDVNINYAGNPAVERDVVEKVASYGKQLGIITDAVLKLAGKTAADDEDPIERLQLIADRIEALKNLNKVSLANAARDAMARLAKAEPESAQCIAAEYAKPSSA
jgi:hypothetical protein